MKPFLTRFLRDESGATAIEYGLIVACVFLAIVGAVQYFAATATTTFNNASDAIVNAG